MYELQMIGAGILGIIIGAAISVAIIWIRYVR